MAGLEVNIYVSTAITWVAAIVALIMRMFARRMTKQVLWYDDYFCMLAFVFASLYSATVLEWTIHWSLGQYMPDDLDTAAREQILHWGRFIGFFNSLTYAFSIASAKLAILFLYWRLFQLSAIRIPIRVMIVLTFMWIIVRTFMTIFRCLPVQAYWDKTIPHAVCRINDTQFFFGTVLTHFLMDVAILVLPIIEVFKLRLRLGQKIAVAGLFTLGTIVCVASVCAIVEAVRYDPKSKQMPHDYGMYCVWGSVEINIAIVSACFPLLRPIFRHILPARFLSSYGGSSQPISFPTHAIRLTTIRTTNKETERDDSSSTHQLADPESGVSDITDYDLVTVPVHRDGVHTVISSPYHEDEESTAGIHVRNDMIVEVVKTEHPKAFRR
ncbi:integral membrane [Fusarium albosuccineum]|uniref:Integral membrane n=1 Tax=Fusarium albosuccineum TaxID=1237068 RepID=A0A8H4KZ03_9HYPO|nr:integral membrane [Fusarium albosuccineum]